MSSQRRQKFQDASALLPPGTVCLLHSVVRPGPVSCNAVHHSFQQGCVVAGRPQEAAAVVKLPKALLQQHCQKLGWAPPRFDKLPLGGGRLPTAALRYSVTLEPAPQGKVPPPCSSPQP